MQVFYIKGKRLTKLPRNFKHYDKFEITSWSHDPTIATTSNILLTINDASVHAPILVECLCIDSETGFSRINMAFNHPSVKLLHEKLGLQHFIGYLVMLNPFRAADLTENINYEDWVLFDLHYGIPLFDKELNLKVLSKIKEFNLGSYENMSRMVQINRKVLYFYSFINISR